MKAEKQALCLLVFYLTLCLWLVGCTEKQEVDPFDLSDVRNVVIDTITTVGDGLQISGTGRGPGLIIEPVQPCPPDTEYMLIQLRPAHFIRPAGSTYYEITIEHKSFREEQPFQYKSKPDTPYQWPPGRWVKGCLDSTETKPVLFYFHWPCVELVLDSVFILKDND